MKSRGIKCRRPLSGGYLDHNQGGSSSDSHRLDKSQDDTNETYLEYRHDNRLPVSKDER